MPTAGPTATDERTWPFTDRRTSVQYPGNEIGSWDESATQSFDALLTVSDTSGWNEVGQFRGAHAIIASDTTRCIDRRTTMVVPSGEEPWATTDTESLITGGDANPTSSDPAGWQETVASLTVIGLTDTDAFGGIFETQTELDIAPGVPPVNRTDTDESRGPNDQFTTTVYRPAEISDGRWDETATEQATLSASDASGSSDRLAEYAPQVRDRSRWDENQDIDQAGNQFFRRFRSSRWAEAASLTASHGQADTADWTDTDTEETATAGPADTIPWGEAQATIQVTESFAVTDSSRMSWTHIEVIRVPDSPDKYRRDRSGWEESEALARTDRLRGEALGTATLTARMAALAGVE